MKSGSRCVAGPSLFSEFSCTGASLALHSRRTRARPDFFLPSSLAQGVYPWPVLCDLKPTSTWWDHAENLRLAQPCDWSCGGVSWRVLESRRGMFLVSASPWTSGLSQTRCITCQTVETTESSLKIDILILAGMSTCFVLTP